MSDFAFLCLVVLASFTGAGLALGFVAVCGRIALWRLERKAATA